MAQMFNRGARSCAALGAVIPAAACAARGWAGAGGSLRRPRWWGVNLGRIKIQDTSSEFWFWGALGAGGGRPAPPQACVNRSFQKRIPGGLHGRRTGADEMETHGDRGARPALAAGTLAAAWVALGGAGKPPALWASEKIAELSRAPHLAATQPPGGGDLLSRYGASGDSGGRSAAGRLCHSEAGGSAKLCDRRSDLLKPPNMELGAHRWVIICCFVSQVGTLGLGRGKAPQGACGRAGNGSWPSSGVLPSLTHEVQRYTRLQRTLCRVSTC